MLKKNCENEFHKFFFGFKILFGEFFFCETNFKLKINWGKQNEKKLKLFLWKPNLVKKILKEKNLGDTNLVKKKFGDKNNCWKKNWWN